MDLGKKIEATRQLGSEFLTWMLFRSVVQEGIFETEAGQVELWFEDKITLVSPFAGGEINILKGEAPAETRESLTAILKGKQIEEAKLSITFQERRWDFSFNGPKFLFSGVKVPAVLGDTDLETVMERFDLMATLEETMANLYHEFLNLRLDDQAWGVECQNVERWLRTSV